MQISGADPEFVLGGGGERNFVNIEQRSRGDEENLSLKIGDPGGGRPSLPPKIRT